MILLSLLGEQPIPNLLVARRLRPTANWLAYTDRTKTVGEHLQKLLPGARLLKVEPYALEKIMAKMQAELPPDQPATFNLTGGTKPMMLAAYELARQRRANFVYLESERRQSRLYEYAFTGETPTLARETTLPALITAADYLNAYLPGFREEGPSSTEGGPFEQAVATALQKRGFEVLQGVRPQGVADQIDIDLVIRANNQVGIAEVKLGGGDSPKKAVDQLNTAGEQKYLGTYTAKFITTARALRPEIRTLAQALKITSLVVDDYHDATRPLLSKTSADKLAAALAAQLGSPNPPITNYPLPQ